MVEDACDHAAAGGQSESSTAEAGALDIVEVIDAPYFVDMVRDTLS